MKSRDVAAARVRMWIWIAGAVLTTSYYFLSGASLPRRTSIGTERRLFGVGDGSIQVQGSPSGRRWIITGTLVPSKKSVMGVWDRLPPVIREYHWPHYAGENVPPRMAPFLMTGTWLLEGRSVRRAWDFDARGWLGEHRLWFSVDGFLVWPKTIILDLGTRRGASVHDDVVRGQLAEQNDEVWWDEVGPDSPDPEHFLRTTLANPLEQLPADFAGEWDYSTAPLGGGRVFLVTTHRANGRPVALYVVTDEPAPRILRVARNAQPLALGRDGRTLFFERDRALWRLDFRKPVAALLAEMPVPELRDPLDAP